MGRKAVSILFYGISVVLTGLLLVAAVLCRYASSVSPGEGGFWATLALLMPVVLLANVVALVWWTVRRKWIVLLMPLVALVLNLGPWYSFPISRTRVTRTTSASPRST